MAKLVTLDPLYKGYLGQVKRSDHKIISNSTHASPLFIQYRLQGPGLLSLIIYLSMTSSIHRTQYTSRISCRLFLLVFVCPKNGWKTWEEGSGRVDRDKERSEEDREQRAVSSVCVSCREIEPLSGYTHVRAETLPLISRDLVAPSSLLRWCILGRTLWENQSSMSRMADRGKRYII